ncbi:hypothetical protein [Nitrosomonas sp. Nm34]|uniref:hypothetical protein n=1 Tax=Nitrosomonas sp. Nm34 TaxID=1881055 RepID=UPI0008EFDA82|nr:hypothetical protein [Nitrosomonas sp. Nm34]SFI70969.1 hypothetical protein SAMN05428978_102837 [Nitrosomonas sp. Nm34]
MWLENPYFIAIGIPVALLLSGAMAKKLVRGSTWKRQDFFLGVEFTLAAMSAALVFIFDLVAANQTGSNPVSPREYAETGSFLATTFFLLLWIMSTHQDWEPRNDDPRAQIIWLGVIANLVGAGLLVAFVLLVKGVT